MQRLRWMKNGNGTFDGTQFERDGGRRPFECGGGLVFFYIGIYISQHQGFKNKADDREVREKEVTDLRRTQLYGCLHFCRAVPVD